MNTDLIRALLERTLSQVIVSAVLLAIIAVAAFSAGWFIAKGMM